MVKGQSRAGRKKGKWQMAKMKIAQTASSNQQTDEKPRSGDIM